MAMPPLALVVPGAGHGGEGGRPKGALRGLLGCVVLVTTWLLFWTAPALAPAAAGGTAIVGGDALRSAAEAAPGTPAAQGSRKVAVLMVRFDGSPEQPWPESTVREMLFTGAKSVNAFYREQSHGQISLTGKLRADGDVFGWYKLPRSAEAGCDMAEWVGEANAIAEADGVPLADYDDVFYNVSSVFACEWGGFATPYGIFIRGTDISTFAHELGHKLGLWHSKSLICKRPDGTRASLEGKCEIKNYGDPFDVMGSGRMSRTHNWNLVTLGVLSTANLRRISKSGVYEISSSLSPIAGTTNLQIPHTVVGAEVKDWFDLEIKQQDGTFEAASDASKTGVTVRLVADHRMFNGSYYIEPVRVDATLSSSFGSMLIDANPATATLSDAPIAPGQSLDLGTATATVLSAEDGKATVAVLLDGSEDSGPPTTPTQLSGAQQGTAVALQWAPSSDDLGVIDYTVLRDGTQIGRALGNSFTDPRPPPGPRSYAVYAKDLGGGKGDDSAPYAIDVADVTAPTVPKALAARQDARSVVLSWKASFDDDRVAKYAVLRDGVEIGTAPDHEYTDSDPPVGPHAYAVQPIDPAGSQGPAAMRSITVADITPPGAPTDLTAAQKDLGAMLDVTPPVLPVFSSETPPRLRVQRRPNGAFRIEAGTADPDVVRLAIWVDGRRLLSHRGRRAVAFWRPPADTECRSHRALVRAYDGSGSVQVASREIKTSIGASRCRGRQR